MLERIRGSKIEWWVLKQTRKDQGRKGTIAYLARMDAHYITK